MISMPLGLYISVPFCRTKCSYCNFASDVFSRAVFGRYVDRLCSDVELASDTAQQMGARLERDIDSVYLGGGTPTVLDITQLQRLFVTISQNFQVQPSAEITVECAPGTLTPAMIDALHCCGVNRVSLGVQSFVDNEAAAVGRLHKRETVLDDISRLRSAGIANINIDLIAGLPHQTAESWGFSLAEAVASRVPHVSVYMLEVDEDSRLGHELIAGGTRYHAHHVPDEDLIADMYSVACGRLEAAGVRQYEISNFAREAQESRHNLKYWTRQSYLGFGVDAHSMLWMAEEERLLPIPNNGVNVAYAEHPAANRQRNAAQGASPGCATKEYQVPQGRKNDVVAAVRFSTPDSLESYLGAQALRRTDVFHAGALEETFFLGLRLSQGLDLQRVEETFGIEAVAPCSVIIAELVEARLLEQIGNVVRLTPRGRLLSNEVFERFISIPA
jgi:oxygen-independent coproporphyrinogen-3 oxidase